MEKVLIVNPIPVTITGLLAITSGTYTGNGAQNRGIPHLLGKQPKQLLVSGFVTIGEAGYITCMIDIPTGKQIAQSVQTITCTVPDATNFYVGDATGQYLNVAGRTYFWYAIG